MAISEAFVDTGTTISTTEYSLPRDANYDSGQVQTDDGIYQILIDFTNMAAGDEYQIRIYEKVYGAGTQRIVYQSNLVGPQSPAVWVSPALMLLHGWDVTLDKIAGTDRSISWSIRKVN